MRRNPQSETPKANRRKLLTQEVPARTAHIADAVVIKDGDLYFLCRPDGSVPLDNNQGLGLYFHDCRFLSGYELRIADACPERLASNDADGFRSIFQLANPKVDTPENPLERHRLGICLRHVIDAQEHTLRDELVLENYDTTHHRFSLSLTLDADFRDVFIIRGLVDKRPGELDPPRWEGDELVFSYHGGDRRVRQLRVGFSEPPTAKRNAQVTFDLPLEPHASKTLVISFRVDEFDASHTSAHARPGKRALSDAESAFDRSIDNWMQDFTRVRSSDLWVERTIDRALRDLRALRTALDGHRFFAAGVPWFATLFGRDSLICALQTLAYRPGIAAETLRLLAHWQGREVNPQTDEEPGKILHEFRSGELAAMGAIPYSPYYGTVDATALFMIVLGEYVRWTGDLALFRELESAVNAALRWISEIGDHDGDGYLDYEAQEDGRLVNQGWKDAGGSIVDSDGSSCKPPIALVEVQGYAFMAKQNAAYVFERLGEHARATTLRREASDLRTQFNRDFWLPKKNFYALALQHGGHPADVISSNPGQALWTGIIADERVKPVVERLMQDDMYSGWGIRTLSSEERAYNPVGYHLGTVWPHDNALIAAGFRQHGFDTEACRIFADLLHAATHFEHYRLPEVFAGYARAPYGVPVRYPVACHPQAWAAGSIPYLLQVLLGIEPDAFEHHLRVVRPVLPAFIDSVTFERLRVGEAEIDLHFERAKNGTLEVQSQKRSGNVTCTVAYERMQ